MFRKLLYVLKLFLPGNSLQFHPRRPWRFKNKISCFYAVWELFIFWYYHFMILRKQIDVLTWKYTGIFVIPMFVTTSLIPLNYEHRYVTVCACVKAITGLDMPWGLQEVEAPRISRHSAQEDGKVVSATHRLSRFQGRGGLSQRKLQ